MTHYRNGTYIAFHAAGTTDPTASDIKYYNMMKAWHENDAVEFRMVNSHEKVSAVRDTSQKATIYASLRERLKKSKNMLLFVTSITKNDTDFVPYEITYAVDTCEIPIIAVYPNSPVILNPKALANLWPDALKIRIDDKTARVIHIPFNRKAVQAAIGQYSHDAMPKGPLSYYTKEAHVSFGINVS